MGKSLRTLSFLLFLFLAATANAQNFVITSSLREDYKIRLVNLMEGWRSKHAIELTGKDYPNWSRPCTVTVMMGHSGNGGATSFSFDKGEVFGFEMKLQAKDYNGLETLLIPHEVMHTVLATYYREPLPRWADEGWCCNKEGTLRQYQFRRIVPFQEIMAYKDYPRDVGNFYAQSEIMVAFFISLKDEATFRDFLYDYMKTPGDWPVYLKKYYGFDSYNQAEAQFREYLTSLSGR